MSVHPIEAESYRILASRVDLGRFGPMAAAVVGRVIHASADVGYVATMVVDEATAVDGVAALRAGAPVVTDVEMVRHGLAWPNATCYLGAVPATGDTGTTRSALGMRLAARANPHGTIAVVGCAPTALFEILRMAAEGSFRPALVIGMPVGFVGAAEAKAALRASGLPAITNTGEKGGSAVAAAAFNALARLATDSSEVQDGP